MKANEPSRTAMYVALGRAAAHGRTRVRGFSGPVALRLLPDRFAQPLARIDRPISLRDRFFRRFAERMAQHMPLRTVAIDEGLRRGARSAKQVVILGAGLDARAWRMPELGDQILFEVDHPATQQYKRECISPVAPTAKEVRFVAVDFERDRLAPKLAEAGHDPRVPTVWVWEGVVMYLRPKVIEATLRVIAGLSAPDSHLLVHYASPSLRRFLVGWYLALIGEPHRSALTREAMADLLGRTGFSVVSDESAADWAEKYGGTVRWGGFAATQRLATARVPR